MGALIAWDYYRQFGAARLSALVVVDQLASDLRQPDWPHGLDFAALCRAVAALQDDQAGYIRDFVPRMFAAPPTGGDLAWMAGVAVTALGPGEAAIVAGRLRAALAGGD